MDKVRNEIYRNVDRINELRSREDVSMDLCLELGYIVDDLILCIKRI